MKRRLRDAARWTATFALLVGVYLVVSLPFKMMEVIPGFADVRPVAALQPAYGIFFGIPGCVAFACGNLITDIASDSLRWSSIAGFAANFLYPWLWCMCWRRFVGASFDVRTAKHVGCFAAITVLCACVQSAAITPVVALAYPHVDAVMFAISVATNHALFPLFVGFPLVVIMHEEFGRPACGIEGRKRPARKRAQEGDGTQEGRGAQEGRGKQEGRGALSTN